MERLTVSVAEMAQMIGVSRPTAYKLARSPGFPAVMLGGRIIIPVDLLKKWMEQNAGQRRDGQRKRIC